MTWRRSFRPCTIPRGPGSEKDKVVKEGTKICLAFGVSEDDEE